MDVNNNMNEIETRILKAVRQVIEHQGIFNEDFTECILRDVSDTLEDDDVLCSWFMRYDYD